MNKLTYKYHERSDAWIIEDEDGKVLSYHCSEEHACRLVACWNYCECAEFITARMESFVEEMSEP